MKLWWIASIESRRSLLSNSFLDLNAALLVLFVGVYRPQTHQRLKSISISWEFLEGAGATAGPCPAQAHKNRSCEIVEIIWALDQIVGTCRRTCHCLWSGASSSLCASGFFGLNLGGLRMWYSKQIYNRSIPFFHGQKLRYKRSQLHQYSHNQWHNQHLLLRPGGLESVIEVIIDSSFLPPEAITPQVTRNGIHYREALMDLGKWKKFMATWHWNLGGGWG